MTRKSSNKSASPGENHQPGRKDLLDALEKIRVLLEKEAAQAESANDTGESEAGVEEPPAATEADSAEPQEQAETGDPVPLLDDMVGGGLGLDESPLTERTAAIDNAGGLDDDLFAALLGDAWKTSAAEMLSETRADIEAHRESWSPEQTDSLNEALRVRIDETLKVWLHTLVRENLEDMRNTLLAAIDDQLKQEIKNFLADRAGVSDTNKDDSYGQ